jgi:phospholipase/carboxylesterase
MASPELYFRPSPPAEGFYSSVVPTPQAWPVRTFLPTGYEPNYPYPLMVFLHGHGSSEEQILRLAPRLSRRNYISIALRGPKPMGHAADGRAAFTWGAVDHDDPQVEEYVFRAVEQTRRHYHVHSERIYLAGFREGAALAYRLGLQFPERFAGIISLNGAMPRQSPPRLRLPDVRGLRIMIGHGIANSVVPLSFARQDYRLFYAAGLTVRMDTYASNHKIHPNMLRDINRWVMSHVSLEMDVETPSNLAD